MSNEIDIFKAGMNAGPMCPSPCETVVFEPVSIPDFNMTFICCTKCGKVIGHRDDLLIAKLDKIEQLIKNI